MSKRITFVADELLGYAGNGIGTTTAFLAVALSRLGHDVEVLYLGAVPTGPVEGEWQQLYESNSIEVTAVGRGSDRVEPAVFARLCDVADGLAKSAPDVVVAQDLGGPAYVALRLRRLGLAFERTSFVVICHSTRQWIADVTRKVRVLPGALAVSVLERACVELADVIVSPSAYMVDWMRGQGWSLPEHTLVIPSPTRSEACGARAPDVAPIEQGDHVERLAFFGRLEERKGVRPFVAALNALDPELLSTVELEFLGRATSAWPPERIEDMLSEAAKGAVRSLSFETELDQHEVLARLRRPGTLAVMPSLEDNSPTTVCECLEHGIPFIASAVGGAPELVAADDQDRVLFRPDPVSIENALRRALSNGRASLQAARPALAEGESVRRWGEVVDLAPLEIQVGGHAHVDAVVVHRDSAEGLARCLGALERQTVRPRVVVVLAGPNVVARQGLDRRATVVTSRDGAVEAAREAAMPELRGEWVCLLDEWDVPEPNLVETLVRAQAASGADVVSCGIAVERDGGSPVVHLFPGQPRGLGVLSNGYGTVCLLRRSLLDSASASRPAESDPDWPLLARLSADGAHIVSVPSPLVTRQTAPGTLETAPGDALLVLEQLERTVPQQTASIVRLAAGLAADRGDAVSPLGGGLARRALRRLKARLR